MSIGPSPGISGNLALGSICLNCQDDKGSDPKESDDYGGKYATEGTPPDACPTKTCPTKNQAPGVPGNGKPPVFKKKL